MQRVPHGRDLRKGRVSLAGQFYLVTCVTCARKKLFADLYAGRCLVRQLMRSDGAGWVNTLAYVIMPDHLHWLFVLEADIPLSTVVGNVKRHSSRAIRAASSPGYGAIWQRGFHDHALRKDESLIAAARYIIANPLRAGLVTGVGDYPLWDAVWL